MLYSHVSLGSTVISMIIGISKTFPSQEVLLDFAESRLGEVWGLVFLNEKLRESF